MPDPAPPAVSGAPVGETGTPITPKVEDEGVTITLDGRQVRARKGEMLIAAAERAGTYVPRFCYHPRMKPVGMCRMCLVDVKGPRGFSLTPACYVPVADGMEVVTKSDSVKKAQDGVLEFLLVNHPLDCPVCDKGGECPLQDQTMAYGPGETRFVEEKRHWDKPVALSPLVLIDRERCIQCARCTRFAEEVAGDAAIDFASRSDSTEVAIFPGKPFSSNFSGNVVQICPVGALLAKPYRFKARPWDLEQVETTCTLCAVGCRVAAQSTSDKVVRFIGVDSDPVNWGWLCDKGRFGFEAIESPERLAHPLVRRPAAGAGDASGAPATGAGGDAGNTELVEAGWEEAFAEVAARLKGVPGDRVGVIGGARLANEDAYAWARFARTVLHTDNVDAQLGDGLPADVVAGLARATIDEVCAAQLVVTISGDIKEELPVLYLRLRHAVVEEGARLIELSPAATGLSALAAQSLRYRPGELAVLARALVSGDEVTEDVAGVAAKEVDRARRAIAEASQSAGGRAGSGTVGERPADGSAAPPGPAVAVVIGRPSLAEPAGDAGEAALALAGAPGTAFLPALRRSNVHGAIDLGLAPGLLPGRVGLRDGRAWYEERWGAPLPAEPGLDTLGMLTRAAAGRLDVVFLVGADPLADCPDRGLAALALQSAGFVVAVDVLPNQSHAYADVVFPAAAYTERRGSFTNAEGRVSLLAQKVTAPGTARPDWMIVTELAEHLGGDPGPTSVEEIWAEIEQVSPLHAGLSLELLASPRGRNGIVVPVGRDAGTGGPPGMPLPLDPMADPGIVSAELHPAPPARNVGAGSPGPGSAGSGSEGSQAGQAPEGTAGPSRAGGAVAGGAVTPAKPAYIALRAPGPAAAAAESGRGASSQDLRLVTSRPMWDGGALVQSSRSLAGLHPDLALSLNPADLDRLGAQAGGKVRVSSRRGSAVVGVKADPAVSAGTALMPFNLPGGGAGVLIDASAPFVEVSVEQVGAK